MFVMLFTHQAMASLLCITRVMNASGQTVSFYAKDVGDKHLLGSSDGNPAYPWTSNQNKCLINDPIVAEIIDNAGNDHIY